MKKTIFIERTMKNLEAEQARLERRIENMKNVQTFIEKNEKRHALICEYFKRMERANRFRYNREYGDLLTDFKSELYHKAITDILRNPNLYANPMEGEKVEDITIKGVKKKNPNAVRSSVRNILVKQGILSTKKEPVKLRADDGHYRTMYIPQFELTQKGRQFSDEWFRTF